MPRINANVFPRFQDGQQLLRCFRTSVYKMNYLETPTGLKMVLNTDLTAATVPELLKQIYKIYVDCVLRNPLIEGTKTITSEAFHSQLNEAVETHPCFA
ncbi:hypothetical protein L596_020178 [Steinernema carpocapsae]|uniref:Trafficking protein particle complex subunit n=1 Tax=Steinernema carpocapsae TaxID=34508 RepID=A0A4V6A0X5_STECR|nr:hypothetical protein L596_020178 [Steinernema carpocapsae]